MSKEVTGRENEFLLYKKRVDRAGFLCDGFLDCLLIVPFSLFIIKQKICLSPSHTDLHRLPLLLDLLMKRDTEIQFLVFTCRPGDYLSYLTRTEEKYLRSINLEEVMKID